MFLALQVWAFVLAAMFGGWLSYQVWTALKSGRANLRDEVIRRKTRPLYYWLVVGVWAGFALMLFVALAVALARELWSAAV
jgi:hypothetical protein